MPYLFLLLTPDLLNMPQFVQTQPRQESLVKPVFEVSFLGHRAGWSKMKKTWRGKWRIYSTFHILAYLFLEIYPKIISFHVFIDKYTRIKVLK